MDSYLLPSLSSPWLPLLLLLLLLLPILSLFLLSKPKNKLSNLPPTPPKLPFVGNLHQLGKMPHRSWWNLSRRYGPVMFLQLGGVPTIVVSTPEIAKQVLKTHDAELCSRPYSHGAMKLTYNFLDVAFGPYSDYWKDMRKLCVMELFAVKRVQSFYPVRERELTCLIDSISQQSGRPIKLDQIMFAFQNSVVCNIAFGKSYKGKQFEGYLRFNEATTEAMTLLRSFWIGDFLPKVGWIIDLFMGNNRRLENCFRDFDDFLERVIEEHLDPDRPKPEQMDIIDVMLELSKDDKASIRLTRDHIKAVLFDIFIGGINTSVLTVVWAMTELMRNPRMMKKAQAEVRSRVGAQAQVSPAEIGSFPYLRMVIKETFRLHPPIPLLLPRQAMQPCQLGGYDVPVNTVVFVNAYAIGRDPGTWKNPDEFYPERFGEEKEEVDFKGQHYELIPFGAGRRVCPGVYMGATGVELTLANLLHCFDWELPEGVKGEDVSVEEEGGLAIYNKHPLYLVPVKYDWEKQLQI